MVNINKYNLGMKLKSVLGIVLIIISVIGMYLWETRIREKVYYTEVLVAAMDIKEGEVAGEGTFKVIPVSPESLVEGHLKASDAESLYGKTCVFPLKKNAQVFGSSFADLSGADDGMYDLPIPGSWCFLGSIRQDLGSRTAVYFMPSGEYAGSYEVVKANAESMTLRCSLEDYFLMTGKLLSDKNCSLLTVPD